MPPLSLGAPGPGSDPFGPLPPTPPATIGVAGGRLGRVPAAAGWRPDLAALASLITPRTRAILWATPNNPSGVVLNEAELTVIAELARRHDLWLVSDEVYAGLAPGGRVPSLADRLPERVVTVGSLSKSHAMTGWRAGWLVGPRGLAGACRDAPDGGLVCLPGVFPGGAPPAPPPPSPCRGA